MQLGDGGIEQKGTRTHGHGQQCGDSWEEWSIMRLNGNGKYIYIYIYDKDYILKKIKCRVWITKDIIAY